MFKARVANLRIVAGYYRGIVIPLLTISVVRAASFTMYTETKNIVYKNGLLRRDRLRDIALAGWLGGATSGCVLSVWSARASLTVLPDGLIVVADMLLPKAFELVKVGANPFENINNVFIQMFR